MRTFNITSDYNAIRSLFQYETINGQSFRSISVSEALNGINNAYYEGNDADNAIIAYSDDSNAISIVEVIGNYLSTNHIRHDILFNEEYNGFELFLYR